MNKCQCEYFESIGLKIKYKIRECKECQKKRLADNCTCYYKPMSDVPQKLHECFYCSTHKSLEESMKGKNILEEAHNIVYERSEEKEREYGPMEESMRSAGSMVEMPTEDVYWAMIGLKLSRLKHKWKRDSAVDLVAYISALNDFYESK